MRYITTSFILIICAAVMGCGSSKTKLDSYPLEKTKWVLSSLNGKDASTLDTKEVTILFTKATLSFSGNGPCNNYSGSYAATSSGSLTFSGMGSTKMNCDNMKVETEYFGVFGSVSTYTIAGDVLSFMDGNKVLARFKAAD